MKIERYLAQAIACKIVNPDESIEDIAHNWSVDVTNLETALNWLADNKDVLEVAIADSLEDRVI